MEKRQGGNAVTRRTALTTLAAGASIGSLVGGATGEAAASVDSTQAVNVDWPSKRGGADNNGVSAVSPPGKPTGTRWEIGSTDEQAGYPAVVDRTVYVNVGNRVVSISVDTGEIQWSFDAAEPTNPPAVDDSSVYVGTDEGTVISLSRSDGSVEWDLGTSATHGPATVYDGRLYIGGLADGHKLFAFTPEGELVWAKKYPDMQANETPPTVGAAEGNLVMGASGADPIVAAIDSANGDIVWQTDLNGYYDRINGPTMQGNGVFVALGEGTFRLSGTGGSQRWSAAAADRYPVVTDTHTVVPRGSYIRSYDTQSGATNWEYTFDREGVTQAGIAGDSAYVAYGGRLVRLTLADGLERWSYEFESYSQYDRNDAGALVPLRDGFLVSFKGALRMLESQSVDPTETATPEPTDRPTESETPTGGRESSGGEGAQTDSTPTGSEPPDTTRTNGTPSPGDASSGRGFLTNEGDSPLSSVAGEQPLTAVSILVTVAGLAVSLVQMLRGGQS